MHVLDRWSPYQRRGLASSTFLRVIASRFLLVIIFLFSSSLQFFILVNKLKSSFRTLVFFILVSLFLKTVILQSSMAKFAKVCYYIIGFYELLILSLVVR